MIRVRWFVKITNLQTQASALHFKRTTVEPVLPQVGDLVTMSGVLGRVVDRYLHEDVQPVWRMGRPRPLPIWHVEIGRR